MKKLMVIFCLLLVNMLLHASPVKWFDGVVVLQSEQVLTGEIALYQSHNVVLLRQNGEVRVYPAHKVRSLYYYDSALNINRKFITIQKSEYAVNRHLLYEIVLMGNVSVLRKPVLANAKDDALGYDYFLYFDQQLVSIRKFKSLIYPKLTESLAGLEDYITKHKLRPAFHGDVIQIVAYYNKQSNNAAVIAEGY